MGTNGPRHALIGLAPFIVGGPASAIVFDDVWKRAPQMRQSPSGPGAASRT
jgi:hypothetical protein